ncbi:hypothetical protein H0R92_12390 [Treponema sp. OMZ 840]|uniref:hypothetical protein n=1 Tax=Treponema sp. OMZ 840 TaxID=244313 RepID=UPI003D908C9B
MDVIQAILDGLAIAAIFNGTAAAFVLINPRFFFDSYPKAIQKAAPEQMTKEEKKINKILTVIIVGICFVYSTASLLHTGTVGFWNLFWTGYIQWSLLNLGDFLLLDCLLFQGKYKQKVVIPGTEGHEDYEFKNWMKHLAIAEHFLGFPFLLIPIISAAQALLVGFLRR